MLNICVIQGRLGQDPELTEHEGKNGPYKTIRFTIANHRRPGDEAVWVDCRMNENIDGKRTEGIKKYYSKGSMVIVIGRYQTYKDKNGVKRSYIRMERLYPYGKNSNNTESAPEGFKEVYEAVYDDEEAPF